MKGDISSPERQLHQLAAQVQGGAGILRSNDMSRRKREKRDYRHAEAHLQDALDQLARQRANSRGPMTPIQEDERDRLRGDIAAGLYGGGHVDRLQAERATVVDEGHLGDDEIAALDAAIEEQELIVQSLESDGGEGKR